MTSPPPGARGGTGRRGDPESVPLSGLFVIWSRGRHAEGRIISDLEQRFELLRLYEVAWTPRRVTRNFRRFYADLPVRGVYHALSKGQDPFLAAVVADHEPRVEERETSRGRRVVNARFLDAKMEYRRWAGELTVHCSETPFETTRDLTMLLGVDVDVRAGIDARPESGRPERLEQDLVGAGGWSSEDELFEVLNRSVRYVVTGAPGAGARDPVLGSHRVNLLTDDYETLHAVLDARPRLPWPRGGPFRVRVAQRWVQVGLRFVGDGFVDPPLAEHLLTSRRRDDRGRYRVPDVEASKAVGYDLSAASPVTTSAAPRRSPVARRVSWWPQRITHAARACYWHIRDKVLITMPWLRACRWRGLSSPAAAARRLAGQPRLFALKRMVLLARGVLCVGRAYQCPCCGWSFRGFTGQWGFLASNRDGYCPRCNSKARHRRLWLYLQENTNLLQDRMRVLEIAPWWAMSRRLIRASNLRYIGLDLARRGPHVTVVGDATRMPLAPHSLDAALCIHTLEHVEDDRRAMRELQTVLRPGGWAVVSVPLRMDGPTHEDATVTEPEERAREFGERSHVRLYGLDIEERLKEAGFTVHLDRASRIPAETRRRFGLRDDENLFVCRKPVSAE